MAYLLAGGGHVRETSSLQGHSHRAWPQAPLASMMLTSMVMLARYWSLRLTMM